MYFLCSLQGKRTREEGSSRQKSYDLNTLPLNASLWDLPTPCQRFKKKHSARDYLEYRWHSATEFHWETEGHSEKANYGWEKEAAELW